MPNFTYSKGLENWIACSCSRSLSQIQFTSIISSFTTILYGQSVAYGFHLYTPLFAERDHTAPLRPYQPSDPRHSRWTAGTD